MDIGMQDIEWMISTAISLAPLIWEIVKERRKKKAKRKAPTKKRKASKHKR